MSLGEFSGEAQEREYVIMRHTGLGVIHTRRLALRVFGDDENFFCYSKKVCKISIPQSLQLENMSYLKLKPLPLQKKRCTLLLRSPCRAAVAPPFPLKRITA